MNIDGECWSIDIYQTKDNDVQLHIKTDGVVVISMSAELAHHLSNELTKVANDAWWYRHEPDVMDELVASAPKGTREKSGTK